MKSQLYFTSGTDYERDQIYTYFRWPCWYIHVTLIYILSLTLYPRGLSLPLKLQKNFTRLGGSKTYRNWSTSCHCHLSPVMSTLQWSNRSSSFYLTQPRQNPNEMETRWFSGTLDAISHARLPLGWCTRDCHRLVCRCASVEIPARLECNLWWKCEQYPRYGLKYGLTFFLKALLVDGDKIKVNAWERILQ